ncbi:DUF3784 domain-containing protein [Enterococcus sp. LJL98]
MNMDLLMMGIILVILGYLVGVKKCTWLLAGYNQGRVLDKEKLAKSVGLTYACAAALFIISGFIGVQKSEIIGGIAVGLILLQLIYVQIKMVV